MLQRLAPFLTLVLLAMHAPEPPAPPPPSAPARDVPDGTGSPSAWILFQDDLGDSVVFDEPWPVQRRVSQTPLKPADTLRYIMPDRSWLKLTDESPPGEYVTRSGDTVRVLVASDGRSTLEFRPLERTTYRFSVRSSRGVAIVVREFSGDPASVPTAPPPVDSLLAFRRGMDALNLSADHSSQVVILPADWYRYAAIRVPDEWQGLTAWFFVYGEAALPRRSGQLVKHIGPYRPQPISPDEFQARRALQYPTEELLRTARPLGGVLLEAGPNGCATDVKDLEDD